MKATTVKYKFEIIGAGIGAIGGFLYWYFVGCTSGTCAITSNPYRSSLYGALLGALLLGIFRSKEIKAKK